MKILTEQFPPSSCYFLSPKSMCSPCSLFSNSFNVIPQNVVTFKSINMLEIRGLQSLSGTALNKKVFLAQKAKLDK
jgi:hypothetical protein